MTLITLKQQKFNNVFYPLYLQREDDDDEMIPTVSPEALAYLKGTDLEKIEQLARFLTEYDPKIKFKYRYKDKKFCCHIDWLCRSAIAVASTKEDAQSLALTDFIKQLQHPRNHQIDWKNYYFYETFATDGKVIGFYGYFLLSAYVHLYLSTQLQYLYILILLYPTGFQRNNKGIRLKGF